MLEGVRDDEIGQPDAGLPARSFGWWDMFVPPEDDPREDGAGVAGERGTLVSCLRDRRLTLKMKCAGLDAAAMARRSVEPSNLSLLGLVRHMADCERFWFRDVMARHDTQPYYPRDPDDNAFDGAVAEPKVVAAAWEQWRAEVAFAERFVTEAPSLDMRGYVDNLSGEKEPVELRQVLVHMIEEYARHNGHADFLRERIDGRVGQ